MNDLRPDEYRSPHAPVESALVVAVTGNKIAFRDGRWHTHHSFGRIVDLLAQRVNCIEYHAPQSPDAAACDYAFAAPNVRVIPWSVQRNSLEALRSPLSLLRGYCRMTRDCDAVFVRGSGPLNWILHWRAAAMRLPIVHWVVGDPYSLLRAQPRGYGTWMERGGTGFAWFEQKMLRYSTRLSRAHVIANGRAIAELFRGSKVVPVVSTSITKDDFWVRDDTCQLPRIRLLFVGYVRPEKGLEYLIRAMPLIRGDNPVDLAIVGSTHQFPAEEQRLRRLAVDLGVAERISWEGYAPFGPVLFSQMDRSDILALPSLSEGTPRVLVEARARSLPLVSTNVGGIPSSIIDGRDGLLVPPADPEALASAISRILADGELRRGLIEEGRRNVADWTVEKFVARVASLLIPRARNSVGDSESRPRESGAPTVPPPYGRGSDGAPL